MSTLLNLVWFILGGWVSALAWLLAAAILAVSLIGLPWAPAAARMAALSAAPFGRLAVSRITGGDTSLALNLVWLLLAGWWLALHHVVLALVLAVTLIGIPFAFQHVKLAGLALAPVGKTIVDA